MWPDYDDTALKRNLLILRCDMLEIDRLYPFCRKSISVTVTYNSWRQQGIPEGYWNSLHAIDFHRSYSTMVMVLYESILFMQWRFNNPDKFGHGYLLRAVVIEE